MTFLRFATRRAAPALATTGVGAWALLTTLNDDWDDYTYYPKTLIKANTSSSSTSTSSTFEKPERIVILGSGWGGLNALRKCAVPGKEVVVVSPRPHFLYTPLLAGSAVGTITLRSACEPLRAIVENAAKHATGATFVRADARDIDIVNKKVLATSGGGEEGLKLEIDYDKLIIAVGAQPNTFGIPGVQENALFLKEAQDSARLHARLLSNLEKAAALLRHGSDSEEVQDEIDRLLTIMVVGGGPTGVELSAELADFTDNDVAMRYGSDVARRVQIILVEAMPRILAPFDASLANVAQEHLLSKGCEVRTSMAITKIDSTTATLAPMTPRNATPEQKEAAKKATVTEPTGVVVWAAGIGARPLVKKLAQKLGQTDTRGLKVDASLRAQGADGVYVIGDAALSGYAPTAQVAAQQGKFVGRAVRDGVDSDFTYHHAGSLCVLGQGNGIAQLSSSGSNNNNIWDVIGAPKVGPQGDQRALTGTPAFVLWRSLYWTKLLSTRSRLSLAADWTKAHLSGRDVVEPVLQSRGTMRGDRIQRVATLGTSLKRNSSINIIKQKEEERKKKLWFL